jgi:hypothetical protein
MVEVYFLVTKTAEGVTAKFRRFKAKIDIQGYRIKEFRCDNGMGEYSNHAFLDELGKARISFEPSLSFTQRKNGVSERMIRTLNSKARAMLLDTRLPSNFCAESINTACYLHQRTPSSSVNGLSPYEMLNGTEPKLHHLKRFGCLVYKHVPKEQQDKKFGSRSKPCMILGYVHKITKVWRIWGFDGGSHSRRRAMECSNMIFEEEINAMKDLFPQKKWMAKSSNGMPRMINIYSELMMTWQIKIMDSSVVKQKQITKL